MKQETVRAAVVGGDLRQAYLAERLAKAGMEVSCLGLKHPNLKQLTSVEELAEQDAVIFPLPVSDGRDRVNAPFSKEPLSFSRCLDSLREGCLVFGGNVSKAEQEIGESHGAVFRDYLRREETAVLNAVPTAEGAIQRTMEALPITIWNSRCLVAGYGRVGRALANRLRALGAKVTVAARSPEQIAWAAAEGCETIPLTEMDAVLLNQQAVYNTIPTLIFDRERLEKLSPSCLMMDLASKPGGVDLAAGEELTVQVIWALALPGKAAPQTAGEILAETILHMIDEEK